MVTYAAPRITTRQAPELHVRTFVAAGSASSAARRANCGISAGLLPDCPERDDLISVAVELGTNAVQHTASADGGWFTVEVTHRAAVFRLDVTDEGGPRGPQVGGGSMSDCGRGLVIVRALAESCGVRGDRRGRTVWAEIAWAPAAAPEPATAPAFNGYPALRTRVTHPAVFREASAS